MTGSNAYILKLEFSSTGDSEALAVFHKLEEISRLFYALEKELNEFQEVFFVKHTPLESLVISERSSRTELEKFLKSSSALKEKGLQLDLNFKYDKPYVEFCFQTLPLIDQS